jgi:hypothetical protein
MARLDTFAGRPDTLGAGMAVVVDAVLARGFTTGVSGNGA